MSAAGDDVGGPQGLSEPDQPRRRRWLREKPSFRSAKSSTDDPWSWSLGVSDWPIGKADYDLSADQAVTAVLGLGRYYEHAMTTLSRAKDEDDSQQTSGDTP